MTIYLVEKRGINPQGILSVFRTIKTAKACAERATAGSSKGLFSDADGYHDFVVMRCSVGKSPIDLWRWKSDMQGTEARYYWEKIKP